MDQHRGRTLALSDTEAILTRVALTDLALQYKKLGLPILAESVATIIARVCEVFGSDDDRLRSEMLISFSGPAAVPMERA